MRLDDGADLRIGDWFVRRGTSRLERGAEERVLDPKELGVLLHLADRAPDFVSTDDLLDRTWPGVVVGDNAIRQVIARLRRDLGDDARDPQYIETLPKRGYRLLAPVAAQPMAGRDSGGVSARMSPVASAQGMPAEAEPPAQSRPGARSTTRRRVPWLAVGSIVVIGVVVLALYHQSDIGKAGNATDQNETPPELLSVLPFGQIPESMTLGLLPFTVTGDDGQLDRFAQVVQVDLQAALGNTEISTTRAASAQFVVEGNLRRVSESLRLSILLRRQHDGRRMWSHRLDVPAVDLSEFKRAPFIARSIETVFAFILDAQNSTTDNEMARNEYYDGLLAIGHWGFNVPVALGHFQRAVEIDPDYADAYEMIGMMYAAPGMHMRAEAALQPAHEAIRKVLQVQPDFTFGLGFVNVQLDLDYEAAIRNFDHARRSGRVAIGEVENWQCVAYFAWGEVEQALKYCQNAVSRGVVHIQNEALIHLGLVYLAAGRYEEARATFARAADTSGNLAVIPMVLEAAAALRLGDTAPGRDLLATVFQTTDETSRFQFAGLLAELGRTDEAEAVLRRTEVDFDRGRLTPYAFYSVFEGYRILGDLDRAFVWLNRLIDERASHAIGLLKSAPYLEALRADPRFDEAMANLRKIESRGSPTRSLATRCMGAPRETPPEQPLVSCAFAEPGR